MSDHRDMAASICQRAGLPELTDQLTRLLPSLEAVHRLAQEAADERQVPPARDEPPPEGFTVEDWDWLFKRGRGNPGGSRSRLLPLDGLHAAWPVIMSIVPARPAFHREYGDQGDTVPANPSARLAYEIARWLDWRYTVANCYSAQTRWKRGSE